MTHEGTPGLDPALVRGLTEPRYSRRRFLRDAGITVGGLSLASILRAGRNSFSSRGNLLN